MDIDIQYLLALQWLRNATGDVFDEIFNGISKVAVDIMPFLPYVVFWCVGTAWGYRFIGTLWTGELINGIIKLTACAYRPWIRSELIEPAGDSKVAATGYSFPSGHTMCATTLYGTTAVWQYKKHRWIAVTCVVMILLTGFSRNFLGVHTPQDVIVGLIESLIIIFAAGKLANLLAGNEKLADGLSVAGIIVVIGVLAYIQLKPYPMDYVGGSLLVDPEAMMNDTFKACGGFLGFLVAAYVDRHHMHYEVPVGAKNLPILTCAGMGILFSYKEFFENATVVALFGSHWGYFVSRFLIVFFAIVLYPMVIKKYANS